MKTLTMLTVIGLLVSLLISCSGDARNESTKIPTISSVVPASSFPGIPVIVNGTNFGNTSSEITVLFNGVVANEIRSISDTQIMVVVPEVAKTGNIVIKTKSTSITGLIFTVENVIPKITIVNIEPENGELGSLITITGSNFSTSPEENIVWFNGAVSAVTASTATTIDAIVPKDASSGTISVKVVGSKTVTGPIFRVDPPINFKIAFLADSDIGPDAKAVLNLIKSEGANVVVHPGDLNYLEIPVDFENHVNEILGADFPYFYSVGNHDDTVWGGTNGYQSLLEARFQRLGISWQGRLGVLSSFSYQGISFVSSAPDEFGISTKEAGDHIRNSFTNVTSAWKVSFWHKNQRSMQIGGKGDEAGWDVYEESRKAGAIIATGHEHSYSRTFEMSNFQLQTISNTNDTINLIKDNPNTTDIDEGSSFAFVSGIGGKSLRDAENGLENNPWWADVYHTGNGAQYGALFGIFNYNGNPNLGLFYFKDINGSVRDEFFVRTNN